MTRLIEDRVREKEERKDLKKKLEGVTEYLKYSYSSYLKEDDTEPYHSMKYGVKQNQFTEREWL